MFGIGQASRSGPRPLSATRIYNTAKARWSEFRTAMDIALNERTPTVEMVKSVGSCDQLDEVVETYTECIRKICNAAIPRRSSKRGLKLPCARGADSKLEAVLLCIGWGKSVRRHLQGHQGNGKKPGGCLTSNQLETSIRFGRVRNPLGETFFPNDQVDSDDPYHTEIKRRTDGDGRLPVTSEELPQMNTPFTGTEIKNALKAFHPRKAPGIDGFMSNIYQAAMFRDLELFLAMANKRLELGYFPRAWKAALSSIKVIPKPVKDDYTRPKSYRSIGLLPVLGKAVERMLVERLQWHLSLSLYIECAFDNAWWPAFRRQLLAGS
ncbi:LINE-1 reverse transcriptase homolog [Eumeta japonica]|uniref:LINE-1 reverse transcriptase homolog n=1 Tax=Eumeta variegata TaxID=151549 RepID=A0A4C1ZMV6_EUMVA|nr:LINE-1 reverse transcriptase homolog [Eumeta japonica]